MDTTTKYIDNLGLSNTPLFYQNMAGNAQIKRSNSGGVVNSSIIPIVKRINQILVFKANATGWDNAVVGHGLNAIYYTFARWRKKGDTPWIMCNQQNYAAAAPGYPPVFWFEKIETSSTTFGYFDYLTVPPVDIEIEVDVYYVDIPFKI